MTAVILVGLAVAAAFLIAIAWIEPRMLQDYAPDGADGDAMASADRPPGDSGAAGVRSVRVLLAGEQTLQQPSSMSAESSAPRRDDTGRRAA